MNKVGAVHGRGKESAGYSSVRALNDAPDLAALHGLSPERYPFLLQSTASDTPLGRFDILFAAPGDSLELRDDESLSAAQPGKQFLQALDDCWKAEFAAAPSSHLPFLGGWFLYLGYELAAEIEPALNLHADTILPRAFAVRCTAAVVRDAQSGECFLVTENDTDFDENRFQNDVETIRGRKAEVDVVSGSVKFREEPDDLFKSAVLRAKEYIAAGDIYQANLSREWTATMDAALSAEQLYASLCSSNPAPFSGIARWRQNAIISSSPERLIRVRDGMISTRPIAGTRPRSADRDIDESLSAELFAHPKELAEHVMLIDLERNDIGRVSKPGSVMVDEMMVLESYAHVHHIVSNVSGALREGVTPGDTIRAVFPGGTITGCPKVRCMEIIGELENRPRGAYTGSIGYLNRDGSLDLNILIRTIVMHDRAITFRAGSGIVADSDPDAELAETRAKAKGLLKAFVA